MTKTVMQSLKNQGNNTRAALEKYPISHPEGSIIEDFLQDCKLRGLTRHTIETLCQQCQNLPTGLYEERKGFLEDLKDPESARIHTQRLLAAINTFFEFLVFEGKLQGNPIPAFRKRYLRIKLQHNGENTWQPGRRFKKLSSFPGNKIPSDFGWCSFSIQFEQFHIFKIFV